MKRKNIKIGEDHDRLLDVLSKSYGVSESDIIRDALNDYLHRDKLRISMIASIANDENNDTKSMHLKMTGKTYELLKKRANSNNQNVSSEARFRLISSLLYEPVMIEEEIKNLSKNSVELSKIGTNLNHIAKAILSNKIDYDYDIKELLDKLLESINENKKFLKNLRKVSIDRFGYRG